MDWAGASSLDQFWRSSAFPMWLTLAAAGFFALIVLITLLRAEKSVANGALTVITLLAIGIAVAATIHNYDPGSRAASIETQSGRAVSAALPALSCIDDLAGDAVLTACSAMSPQQTRACHRS
jgi:FtsH-binding integral membrane protein